MLIFYLFPLLWGAVISLILCSPRGYYPIFLIILAVSIILFIYSKRFFPKKILKHFILSLIPLLISYSLCCYVVFKPSNSNYIFSKDISKNKKAMIFYCEGEMERYSPKYSSGLLKNTTLLLKPIEALKLKNLYGDIDAKNKNQDIIRVAKESKNSLINNNPYYFYIAYAYYYPGVRNSIQAAINDGCSEIKIINYTAITDLEKELSKDIDINTLKKNGLTISFTKSVYNMKSFSKAIIDQVQNTSLKFDGILILDHSTDTSNKIKSSLKEMGYNESSIIISTDIKASMDFYKQNKLNNILYINLQDSSGSYKSETILPKEFLRYASDMKITGLKSWGYDKTLVKAVVEAITK